MGHHRKKMLSIFINEDCNLACMYCYVGTHKKHEIGDIESIIPQLVSKQSSSPRVISLEFAKRAILDFFDKYESRTIRFFSTGEATLGFNRMKEIRDWVTDITHGNGKFELQTNGYFSPSIAQWIAENIDTVWISCDGPPEIQNRYRPTMFGQPSSNVVARNIEFLTHQPKITVGCRVTIGAANLNRQKEFIDYFNSLGVKAIMSDPIFLPIDGGRESLSKEKINLMDYAAKFLEARQYAINKGIFYGSIFSVNFDEPVDIFCRSCAPYPHLTVDNHITCCDMVCNDSDPKMQVLVYGKYLPQENRIEYYPEKIRAIQSRTVANLTNCQGCKVLHNCAGACLGEAVNETGSMMGIKPDVCEAIRFLVDHMELNKGLYPFLHS